MACATVRRTVESSGIGVEPHFVSLQLTLSVLSHLVDVRQSKQTVGKRERKGSRPCRIAVISLLKKTVRLGLDAHVAVVADVRQGLKDILPRDVSFSQQRKEECLAVHATGSEAVLQMNVDNAVLPCANPCGNVVARQHQVTGVKGDAK